MGTSRRHRGAALRAGAAAGIVVAVTLVAALAAAAPSAAAHHAPVRPIADHGIAGWHLVGHTTENSLTASEGVATVATGRGPGHQIYRGIGTVPAAERAAGWTHVGDPDAYHGDVVDAFQGKHTSKLFLVTTPSGATYRYVHALAPGELYNNSFAAIAPGGQWMVSGTWDTVRHLQVYPAPLPDRRTARHGGPLRLAGAIVLDHAVHDVQACDFVRATELVCSSTGDPSLFTNVDPLLEVRLAHPLRGGRVRGTVVDLGSIPHRSSCTGTYEPEGVDYDTATGVLRVEIIQPGSCILHTTVYEYRQDKGHAAG